MAKKQDFMSKTMRQEKHGNLCPVCGNSKSQLQIVKTERSKKTDAWRFNQAYVGVCKCNEQEIYS